MKFYDTLMQAILRHVRFDGKCVNEWVWQLHSYMYTVGSVLLLFFAFMLYISTVVKCVLVLVASPGFVKVRPYNIIICAHLKMFKCYPTMNS